MADDPPPPREKTPDPFGSPLQAPLLLPSHSSSIFEELSSFISIESSRSLDERLDHDLSQQKDAESSRSKPVEPGGGSIGLVTTLNPHNAHDLEDEMDLVSSAVVRHPLYPHLCCYAYKAATEGIIDVSLEEVFQMNEHLFAKVDHERPDGTTVVDEIVTRNYQDLKLMLDDMKGFSERVESATKKLLQTTRLPPGEEERESKDSAKIRGRISKRARDTLRAWILEHQNHPYPTKEEKHELAEKTQLTFNQVSGWFVNSRRRFLRQLRGNEKEFLSRESEEEVEEMLEDYRPTHGYAADSMYSTLPKADQPPPRLDHTFPKNNYYHPTLSADSQPHIDGSFAMAAHASDPSPWMNEIREDGQDQYGSMQMGSQPQFAPRSSGVAFAWTDGHSHHSLHPQW